MTGYSFSRRRWNYMLLWCQDEVGNRTEISRIHLASWILASWSENTVSVKIFFFDIFYKQGFWQSIDVYFHHYHKILMSSYFFVSEDYQGELIWIVLYQQERRLFLFNRGLKNLLRRRFYFFFKYRYSCNFTIFHWVIPAWFLSGHTDWGT